MSEIQQFSFDDFETFDQAESTVSSKIEPYTEQPEPQPLSIDFDAEHYILEPEHVAYNPAAEWINVNEKMNEVAALIAANYLAAQEIEDKIRAVKTEYANAMQALDIDKQRFANERFELQRAKRIAEQAIQAAELKLREALNSVKMQAEFKANSLRFDEITASLSWREKILPHQVEGAKLMAVSQNCILADVMGLGKTLTSIATCDMSKAQKILVIVPDDIVSNFVREIAYWAPHRSVFPVGKMPKSQRDLIVSILKPFDQFIVVVNYSAWRKDQTLKRHLIELRFDTVIMDEAHTIKNTRTAAFKGVKEIVHAENSCPECRGHIQKVKDPSPQYYDSDLGRTVPNEYFICIGDSEPTGLVPMGKRYELGCGWSQRFDVLKRIEREYGALRSIRRVYPMTGTPILNSPTDLYPLLHMMDDVNYASEVAFLRAYCMQNYQSKWVFKPGGLESLTKQMSGKYIKRTKKDAGVILPKQEVVIHEIEMDKAFYAAQAKVIKDLTEHAMLMLDSGNNVPIFAVIELILRKRQANVWPAGININIKDPDTGEIVFTFSVGEEVQESVKLDRCLMTPNRSESGDWEGLLQDYTGGGDITNGDRVVVFSQFKGPLKELEARCEAAGISVVRLDGDTSEALRDEIRKDFDRRYADVEGYEYKWQVILANYKTGGTGLNLNAATHTIILDEEWNPGKRDQAYARTDRMGQSEESSVDVLRLSNTIDTWLAELIDFKADTIEGFESEAGLSAESLLAMMRKGEM
jgi:SNF2 family DNA or RNA helicase